MHLAIQTHSVVLYPGHLYIFVNSGILPKHQANKVVFCECVSRAQTSFQRVYRGGLQPRSE